jgi:hypothetical protein
VFVALIWELALRSAKNQRRVISYDKESPFAEHCHPGGTRDGYHQQRHSEMKKLR